MMTHTLTACTQCGHAYITPCHGKDRRCGNQRVERSAAPASPALRKALGLKPVETPTPAPVEASVVPRSRAERAADRAKISTPAQVPVAAKKPTVTNHLAGSPVEGLFDDGIWYPGVIKRVVRGGYDVAWDDGSGVSRVKQVRARPAKRGGR